MNPRDVSEILKNIRVNNLHKVIVTHLNVNSFSNKFDAIKTVIPGNVDVMIFSETKLDDSHPTSEFLIDGFSTPFRLDRNKTGGGLLIYVREDIPSKQINNHSFSDGIEGIFVELNLRKTKWLILGTYHPPNQNDKFYFDNVGRALELYNKKYDKILLAGDFNAEIQETILNNFLELYNLRNLVTDKTCFKSLRNPTCIDLFLTNCNKSFQHTQAISTGLSDFHKLILTVLKTTFKKAKPKEKIYRCYKQFDEIKFKNDLIQKLYQESISCDNYKEFESKFLEVLNVHAPLKRRIIRANEVPYMTKALRKAIANRSRLENRFYRDKTDESKKAYKKQKNYCSKLYKKERKRYYANLDVRNITDNKKFWQTMKPFFSDKGLGKNTITLVEGNDIIAEDVEVANTLNSFFENAVKTLNISIPSEYITDTSNEIDPIDNIILKFSNHPSVININNNIKKSTFSFSEILVKDIEAEINALDSKKACKSNSIPVKLLKEYSSICNEPLKNLINRGIRTSTFDQNLKYADLTPVHKKDDTTDKKNYRPISLLPATSKIFERVMVQQIGAYVDKFLSPFLCGYRKGYNAQHALLSLLEKWRVSRDKSGYGGAVLMDLSKAFDTLNHDLFIAKLHAYGFDKNALKLVRSYLTNRWQRTKVNTSFSSWTELLLGVPQGSVLGPLLFNLFINDFFYLIKETDICNYADDNTLHTCDIKLDILMEKLEGAADKAISWFRCNGMKMNSDKCHLLICGHKYEIMIANIGEEQIIESNTVKLLGINIDSDLSFNDHLNSICKKASNKLNVLSRQCAILPFHRRKVLMHAFIISQFNYCPLVWMCHNRGINNKINNLHYRALRMVYDDQTSTFEELLKKDGAVTIHQQNIRSLAVEMFKVINDLAPPFMRNIFTKNSNLCTDNISANTRSNSTFHNYNNPRTINYGLETLRCLGPKVYDMIPNEIKTSTSEHVFKTKIKEWIPTQCPCRLCLDYIPNVGYIN